jgi:hypothetical protein
MSHFAKIENGIVTQVIVAEQDFINNIGGSGFKRPIELMAVNTQKTRH